MTLTASGGAPQACSTCHPRTVAAPSSAGVPPGASSVTSTGNRRCARLEPGNSVSIAWVRRRSAEQPLDVAGPEPRLLVMVLAQGDVVEHVEMAGSLAVLVQPDQRPRDVEGHLHRFRGFIRNERVRLARCLVHPVAGGGHPVVLEIAPLA